MKLNFEHVVEYQNHIGLVDVQVTTDGSMGDCVIDCMVTKDGDEIDMCYVKEDTQNEICEEALQMFRDRFGDE